MRKKWISILKNDDKTEVRNDTLDAGKISDILGGRTEVRVYESIDSTNTEARRLFESGIRHPVLLAAEEQTAGRGRKGKSFYSPGSTGIYMTYLCFPELTVEDSLRITTDTAVVVSEALERYTSDKISIKWVNDLYIGERKFCGILTEASFDTVSDRISYAVVGVGINVSLPDGGFEKELENIAGAISDVSTADLRARLIADFLVGFSAFYERGFESAVEEYRSRQLLIGKEIEILRGGERIRSTAVGVDENCRLCVVYPDGREEKLVSGEVSTRLPL